MDTAWAGSQPAGWPEARGTDRTYKDMVRDFGATNFVGVEDEAKYWLQYFEAQQVEEAMQDAGFGYEFSQQVTYDVLS